jgi:hypothetical protein
MALSLVEFGAISVLVIQIIIYADLAKGAA